MNILEFSLDRLIQTFDQDYGKGRFHARALFREIFKNGNNDFLGAEEFLNSPKFALALDGKVRVDPGQVVPGQLTMSMTPWSPNILKLLPLPLPKFVE